MLEINTPNLVFVLFESTIFIIRSRSSSSFDTSREVYREKGSTKCLTHSLATATDIGGLPSPINELSEQDKYNLERQITMEEIGKALFQL